MLQIAQFLHLKLVYKQGLKAMWVFAVGLMMLLLASLDVLPSVASDDVECPTEANATIPTVGNIPLVLTIREYHTATFPFRLCEDPPNMETVTVTFSITPTGQITISHTELFLQNTLTQTIVISAIADMIEEKTQTITVSATLVGKGISQGTNPPSITVNVLDSLRLHLPLVTRYYGEKWRNLTTQQYKLSTLAMQNDYLYMGESRDTTGGGLYRSTEKVTNCSTATDLLFSSQLSAAVLDITFHNNRGLVGTFGNKTYSSNDGMTWSATQSTMNPYVYGVAIFGNVAYAGADDGIYRSDDQGISWRLISSSPNTINRFYQQPTGTNVLWIGAFQQGLWRVNVDTDPETFQRMENFTGKASEVWDILYINEQTLYIATSDGIYHRSGSNWSASGLQGNLVYALENAGDYLYAGLNNGGVYRASQSAPGIWTALIDSQDGWNPSVTVRDLLYDATYCKGLLAATDEGLWVFRR